MISPVSFQKCQPQNDDLNSPNGDLDFELYMVMLQSQVDEHNSDCPQSFHGNLSVSLPLL
jgi:hypothetical protein